MKTNYKERPKLTKIELGTAIEDLLACKPGFHITMAEGQWDMFLEVAYFKNGATLIELDSNEAPIAAYKHEKDIQDEKKS